MSDQQDGPEAAESAIPLAVPPIKPKSVVMKIRSKAQREFENAYLITLKNKKVVSGLIVGCLMLAVGLRCWYNGPCS